MARHYNVRPRYTPGSPAMVSQEMADRVLVEELRAYGPHLEGWYGEEGQRVAKVLGVKGIAECMIEKRKAWEVTDLATHQTYTRPFGYDQHLREVNDLKIRLSKIQDGTEAVEPEFHRKLIIRDLGVFIEAVEEQRFEEAFQVVQFNMPPDIVSSRLADYVREQATKRPRRRK
jgi:hypothetical protein